MAAILYGITHNRENGQKIVRIPRVLRVGIGVPSGPERHVWLGWKENDTVRDPNKVLWCVRIGKDKTSHFEKMEDARAHYFGTEAPVAKFPKRLRYFTFSKIGQSGGFEPDWEAIKAHGPMPTKIDIIFVSDDPLDAQYEWWSTSELRCFGDGRNAERVVSIDTPGLEAIRKRAEAEGRRRYPIANGCATMGCPYYAMNLPREADAKGADCKPHGTLSFLLANNLMMGGTAYFTTTGKRSILNIASSIASFQSVTGGPISGVTLQMVLTPYKTTTRGGQKTTQSAVHLEYREDTAVELRRRMIEKAAAFRSAGALPRSFETQTPQLSAGAPPSDPVAASATREQRETPAIDSSISDDGGESIGPEEEFDEPDQARILQSEFPAGGGEDEEEDEDSGGPPQETDGDEFITPIENRIDPVTAGKITGAYASLGRSRVQVNRLFAQRIAAGKTPAEVVEEMLDDIKSQEKRNTPTPDAPKPRRTRGEQTKLPDY